MELDSTSPAAEEKPGESTPKSGQTAFEAIPVKSSVFEVVKDMKDTQTIVFGDNGHDDNKIQGMMAKPEMMDALASSGVKHMMLEIPVEQEKYLKAYQGGEMSREDFIDKVSDRWETGYYDAHARERGEQTAAIVDNAAARGIQAHFVDGMEGVTERYKAAYRGPFQDALNDYAAQNGLTKREVGDRLSDPKQAEAVQQHVLAHLDKNNPEALQVMIEDSPESPEFMKKRVGADIDKGLASRIEAAANGEKSAVFYGTAHQIQQNLSTPSSKIDIVGTAAEAESHATGYKSDTSVDFAVSAQDGTVFKSPSGSPSVPPKPAIEIEKKPAPLPEVATPPPPPPAKTGGSMADALSNFTGEKYQSATTPTAPAVTEQSPGFVPAPHQSVKVQVGGP